MTWDLWSIIAAAGSSAPVEANGESGFTSADHYWMNDSGSALPAAATMTIGAMFRLDSLAGSLQNIFSQDDGSPGWSIAINGSEVLSYRDSHIFFPTAYQFTEDDVGETFIVLCSRSNASGAHFYMYKVRGDTISILDETSGEGTPSTSTQSAAIGALGNGTGQRPATGVTIIGCIYGSSYLDFDAAETYLKACAAAGEMVSTMTGAVSCYQAPDLATDVVGSNDMTSVGSTTTEDPFEPSYRDPGTFPVTLLAGQSNVRGANLLSEVPDYSGTAGIDYTATFTDAFLYEFADPDGRSWTPGVRPIDDNQWGPELSLAREAVTNGLDSGMHYMKVAPGGTALGEGQLPSGWNVNDPENIGTSAQAMLDHWDGAMVNTVGSDRSFHPLADPIIVRMLWGQGEADSGDATRAANYQTNRQNFHDWIQTVLPFDPDCIFVETLLPSFQDPSYDHRATVNTAKTNFAAANDNVYLVNYDAGDDKGDDIHDNVLTILEKGRAIEEAFRTEANVTMGTPVAE